ncbi:AAC(3) family N-acetyltransferase [Magnetospira sp. QH-2]|uniref:AAC(3) family N-acetyltransferase n=1 Tax=Magnetospira sp. (strain QH-2) TaxID=1288970 RepID=UPI0003E81AB5|nr:AAC(3) family N-acetyltransferase [Magnetospira sp. QH-2]CCQ75518.1 putative Aminoglycoside N3'-acetyltransferase [Magnetospira sp. QH-2]
MYTYDELVDAYRLLGVEEGRLVYVTSDLGRLPGFETPGKKAVLQAHLGALQSLLGETGTLVVPTASLNLCNTQVLFDPDLTPSHNVGVFSEYVRRLPDARRSFHPFVSYTALGPQAAEIVNDVARHAFGPESPEGRMVERDALSVSIGLYPRFTCSTMHHVEHLMAVPYRYTKEYMHPVKRDGRQVIEPFYQYVWYWETDIERSYGKVVFEDFLVDNEIKDVSIGKGQIFSYSMSQFVASAIQSFKRDLYIWSVNPPTIRPWRK